MVVQHTRLRVEEFRIHIGRWKELFSLESSESPLKNASNSFRIWSHDIHVCQSFLFTGQGNTARLPASVRLEYEAYMQQRLRMMNQGMRQPMVTSGVSGTSMAPFTPASTTLPTSLGGATQSPVTVTSPQLGPSGVGSPKGIPRASTPTGHPSPVGTPTGGPPLQQVQMTVQQLRPGQPRLGSPGGPPGSPIRVSIPNQYMQQSQLQPGQRMEHPFSGHMMRHPGQTVQHITQVQGSGLLSTANKPIDAQKVGLVTPGIAGGCRR
jgi:hypothetical protein